MIAEIEACEALENWSGSLDIANVDDLGTSITDARDSDWDKPPDLFEYRSKGGARKSKSTGE
ncbi:MAG: hypothetical protein GQ561_03980 [Calditrichae bacterium]|nr:hypothetical protein [Calditrichia bacterium]